MSGQLRLHLCVLAGCALACEDSAPAGEAFPAALMETESYEVAVAHCDRIASDELRGDCRVALMESWNRLDPADCESMESPLWRDECLFLLGERQLAAGDLALGLATCEQTRFRRNCAWHLVQDEVQATLELPAPEAEERILAFADATPIPDAAMQFWIIRFRERAGAGYALDEADCETLQDPIPCRAAVERHIHGILDARVKRKLAETCDAKPGERATLNGEPAWTVGEVSLRAEASWVETRCP
jgi:hypothetical protein